MRLFLLLILMVEMTMPATACCTLHKKAKTASSYEVAQAEPAAAADAARPKEPHSGEPQNTPAVDMTAAAVAAKRQVIYTGSITLSVAKIDSTMDAIRAIIDQHQGIIAKSTLTEITFRVPPAQFEPAIKDLYPLGTVIKKEINSEDVTDKYTDLKLRLEVAEASRQRLMTLLQNQKEVKDVIEVERDIRRLTEEIEEMKGAMRLMQDQIDLATITVSLEQKVAETRPRPKGSPFSWINNADVNSLLVIGSGEQEFAKEPNLITQLFFGPKFTLTAEKKRRLPSVFTPVAETPNLLIGLTPEGYRLRAHLERLDHQVNTVEFWSRALAENFKTDRGYQVSKNEPVTFDRPGLSGRLLQTEVQNGEEPYGYYVWLAQPDADPSELYIIEYAQPLHPAHDYLSDVQAAVRAMRTRRCD